MEPWHSDVFEFLDLRKNTGGFGAGGFTLSHFMHHVTHWIMVHVEETYASGRVLWQAWPDHAPPYVNP